MDADNLHPNQAHDYPFYEVYGAANALTAAGHHVHFKFTCEQCGARQTFEECNALYKLGICEECGHTTSLEEHGCNYVIITDRTSCR